MSATITKPMLKVIEKPEVKTEKVRKDGRASRSYFVGSFKPIDDIFADTVKRVFWQSYDSNNVPFWKGITPEQFEACVGKTVWADIISETVVPYTFEDYSGAERTSNTYTTVLVGRELANPAKAFRKLGHQLQSEADAILALNKEVQADLIPTAPAAIVPADAEAALADAVLSE